MGNIFWTKTISNSSIFGANSIFFISDSLCVTGWEPTMGI